MTNDLESADVGWIAALVVGAFVTFGLLLALLKLQWFPFPPSRPDLIHLPICGGTRSDDRPLFTLKPTESDLHVEPGSADPSDERVYRLTDIPSGETRSLRVDEHDRYWFKMRYTGGSLVWWLSGASLRAGDEVGRAPAFGRSGRLDYQVGCGAPAGAPPDAARAISLWMDGLPINAFRVLMPEDCGANVAEDAACIVSHSGAGRVTLATHERVGKRTRPRFIRLRPGTPQAVRRGDTLWIAHLPFTMEPGPGSDASWRFELADDYLVTRGDRRLLRREVFGGRHVFDGAEPVEFHDVTQLFRGDHLVPARWSPMQEDEYQLLIDHELLCVEPQQLGNRTVPQLVWKDPTSPGCPELIPDPYAPPRAVPGALPQAVLDVYQRRLGSNDVVRTTNQILASEAYLNGLDRLGFTFEWWFVTDGDRERLFPRKLWGSRTLATMHLANEELARRDRATAQRAEANRILSRRPIVIQSRRDAQGRERIVSSGANDERVYSNLSGLGPLIGQRRVVTGLDTMLSRIALDVAPGNEIVLTIEPELQANLWSALKTTANRRTIDIGNEGISAVALDPDSGDVLAVLNWPEGTWWETSGDEHLQGSGLEIEESVNRAFRRANKTGSTMKAMVLYTMADVGLFDVDLPKPTSPGPSCGQDSVGLLLTGSNGAVATTNPYGFGDIGIGPLPVTTEHLLHDVVTATAASCNAFFSFAATMLVDGRRPAIEESMNNRCPVGADLKRTDMGKPSAAAWTICRLPRAAASALAAHNDVELRSAPTASGKRKSVEALPELWLLAPPGTNGFGRSEVQAALRDNHGYFARPLAAGYRFDRRLKTGRTDANNPKALYEGHQLRTDWFAELGVAGPALFSYPHMLSPGSLLGWPQEDGGHDVQDLAGAFDWRAFAMEVVGEGARGSALSLAVLYSPLADDDANFPAPRIVREGSSVSTAGTPAPAFAPGPPQRREWLRKAFQAPLSTLPHATANTKELRKTIATWGLESKLFGKTGTFEVERRVRAKVDLRSAGNQRKDVLTKCGVPDDIPNGTSTRRVPREFAADLGSDRCERAGLTMTAVHRYKETPTVSIPDDKPGPLFRGTSFVGVLEAATPSPSNDRARAVVLSVIVDRTDLKARDVFNTLLPSLAMWLGYTAKPEPSHEVRLPGGGQVVTPPVATRGGSRPSGQPTPRPDASPRGRHSSAKRTGNPDAPRAGQGNPRPSRTPAHSPTAARRRR